jgi:predicted naringenin-chalcone synthase
MVGQIVSNKNSNTENQTSLNIQAKKEESSTKKNHLVGQVNESEFKQSRVVPAPQMTEENEHEPEEVQADNDIFLSESVGIDVTIDSAALEQFDYNESVDLSD